MADNSELQQRLGSIEELLHGIESTADPNLRASVQELMELVMNLNGAGIERILELIRLNAGPELVEKLGADELAGNLLILYGLHPLKFEARVARAIEHVRSHLHLHDGEIELLEAGDGVIRMRLNASGCGSNSIKQSVEEALYQFAPDLTTLTIEGAEVQASFVPLEALGTLTTAGKGAW